MNEEIRMKELAEKPEMMDDNKMKKLIIDSVSNDGAYKSLQDAVNTKSGGDLEKARIANFGPMPFDESIAAFKEEAKSLFTGGLRVDGGNFAALCKELLPGDEEDGDENESYCDELCEDFSSSVQDISDESAGAVAGSSAMELGAQLEDLESQLQTESSEFEECTSSRASLQGFKQQLLGLAQDIKDRHKDYRLARQQLAQAASSLKDLTADLGAKDVELAEAIQKVTAMKEQVSQGQQSVQEFQKKQEELDRNIQDLLAQLETTRVEIQQTYAADQVVLELKIAVSHLMRQMLSYSEEVGREPLRKIGLSEGTIVENYFKETKELPGASAVTAALESMNEYCETKAMPVFGLVKEQGVDLTPFCKLGDVPDNFNGITAAMDSTVTTLVEKLEDIQTWVNPYKGLGASTKDNVPKWVAQGEPSGLREIMSVFQRSSFYSQYLTHWRVTDGKGFLNLYKQLLAAHQAALDAEAELLSDLEKLQAKLAEVKVAAEEAATELGNTINQLGEAQQMQEAVQAARDLLKQKVAESSSHVKALEDAVALAKQRLEAAKARLTATHQDGTALNGAGELLEMTRKLRPIQKLG